jgi:hypothetical protein
VPEISGVCQSAQATATGEGECAHPRFRMA